MLKPFCDKERIVHRQDGVALVVRLSNRDFIGELYVCDLIDIFEYILAYMCVYICNMYIYVYI
jgi:hypothetical protein